MLNAHWGGDTLSVMLELKSRPRNLTWLHAGPLLFGDWGTSRLYVLGLAFYYTGHASLSYMAVMSILMAAVAWAYTVICRCFPDGGGVYSASRLIDPTLSVIAATLLLCDFIVTASLSAVEGFHYLGAHGGWVVGLSLASIVVLGVVNWLGARSAGRFALVIAIAAIGVSALVGLLCLPHLRAGLATATLHVEGVDTWWHRWESLVRIVLALSGVEAVANMTGLMKEPVARTAKRTIWPVLIEVVVLNFIFCIALNALPALRDVGVPDYVTHELRAGLDPEHVPEAVRLYRDTAVKLLATHTGTEAFGATVGGIIGLASGIVFGLLLLSAVNTAIMAMVSVMYSLARDRELPQGLAKLNYSGVPWVALIIAVALPCAVLAIEADAKALGELYAIGVVGAIAINVTCCAINKSLDIRRWERIGLWTLGVVMGAVELTIIVAKPAATVFAGVIIGLVLGARWYMKLRARRHEPLPEPAAGWMAEISAAEPPRLDAGRPRIMLAVRGRENAQYAVDLAAKRGAILFAIYVRTLRVLDVGPGRLPRLHDDDAAQEVLGTAAVLARKEGVPFFPIYVTATDIADEVLDYTVTFGCDTLIMGKSRRTSVARAVAGDVLAKVAAHLPEGVELITRATAPPATPQDVAPHADAQA